MQPDPTQRLRIGKTVFSLSFTATPLAVRRGLVAFETYLAGLPIAPERRDSICIVLAEALNNITEHAYPDATGPIWLRAQVKGHQFMATLRDRGAALPAGLLPQPGPNPGPNPGHSAPNPADLPEGGFGWHLIRSLADGLDHARFAQWNELRIIFRNAVPTPPLP